MAMDIWETSTTLDSGICLVRVGICITDRGRTFIPRSFHRDSMGGVNTIPRHINALATGTLTGIYSCGNGEIN